MTHAISHVLVSKETSGDPVFFASAAESTGFLHILPETESGNFMALPGKKYVPRISELWVQLKHAHVGCDNPRNMVKQC